MKKHIIAGSCLCLFASSGAMATDLWHVYQQAVHHDATFAQARAQWKSTKTLFPQAVSQLLPTLNITGQYTKLHTDTYNIQATGTTPFIPHRANQGWYWQYGISINEPIFNFAGWASIPKSRYDIKAATATYLLAAQDLIKGTITDYISVLTNYNVLRFSLASEKAYYRQYLTQQQKFKVGLEPKTSVFRAKALYNVAQSSSIAAKTALRNSLETLSIRTGYHYTTLNGALNNIPMVYPSPRNIQKWVTTALKQNFNLQSQRYQYASAKQNISVKALALMPSVSLNGEFNASNNAPISEIQHNNSTSYGASIDFTFAGGKNIALTHQAYFDALAQKANMNFTRRTTIENTRNDFLNVVSGIRKVQADKRSLLSARKNLQSTQQSYTVGTNTFNDVLVSIKQYYAAQQQFNDDQYAYLNAMIALKYDTGTLSYLDVKQMSRILNQRLSFIAVSQSAPKRSSKIAPILKPVQHRSWKTKHHKKAT